MQILSAPNDYIGEYAPFLKRMADEGFIVEEFTSAITPPKSLARTIDEKNAAN